MFLLPLFLAIVGLFLSMYALVIEKRIHNQPHYKPLCDISDYISCSKPITSNYSKLFGFSNALIGIAYYTTVACITFFHKWYLLLILTSCGLLATLFFCYLLIFHIRAACLVCIATYGVNIALWITSLIILYR